MFLCKKKLSNRKGAYFGILVTMSTVVQCSPAGVAFSKLISAPETTPRLAKRLMSDVEKASKLLGKRVMGLRRSLEDWRKVFSYASTDELTAMVAAQLDGADPSEIDGLEKFDTLLDETTKFVPVENLRGGALDNAAVQHISLLLKVSGTHEKVVSSVSVERELAFRIMNACSSAEKTQLWRLLLLSLLPRQID